MAVAEVLGAVFLGGVMGLIGQGARTVIGLKKLHDENAAKGPNEQDSFIASRLVVSLFIGFIAGVAAALLLDLGKLAAITVNDIDLLLGLAAAGYAGTDIIEAFVARLPKPAGGGSPGGGEGAAAGAAPPKPPSTIVVNVAGQTPAAEGLTPTAVTEAAFKLDLADIKTKLGSITSMITAPAVGTGAAAADDDSTDLISPTLVKSIFDPATPLANIKTHLPSVLAGLRDKGLVDREMVLMALATIRAETEGFVPINEFVSKYNTDKTPFDKYEPGTSVGKNLGNTQPGDGARFRGRGFVQLTGRYNYNRIGAQISANLIVTPTLANDSALAGLILAQFLFNKQDVIRNALSSGDLKAARRAVNGGTHGFDRFEDTYIRGDALLPETATA
jgi:putative chitinase